MSPFLYFDLKAVIRNLFDIVIELVVVEACRCGKQFKEIDLSKKWNLLLLSKINLGFGVEKEINTLTKSDVVTIQQINNFRESARMLYKKKCCTSCLKEARYTQLCSDVLVCLTLLTF